jgi:hypothetical protein
MSKSLSAILALLLLGTSCAAATHGRYENISVISTPPGAEIKLKCAEMSREAVTPATLVIPRNATECILSVSKNGYRTKSVDLDRGVAPTFWLNLVGVAALPLGISDNSPVSINGSTGLAMISAGTIGLGSDALTGSMFRHTPNEVRVELAPEPPR